MLKLQTEIATAVANALKVTLLDNGAVRIEVGGTRNLAAFDAYLRATKTYWAGHTPKDVEAAIVAYTQAIDRDPAYALAYAGRAIAYTQIATVADYAPTPSASRTALDKAEADARRATGLAPNLSEGHVALAQLYWGRLEYSQVGEEYGRALALGPGNARVLRDYGLYAVLVGQQDFGLTLLRRAMVLDPLNASSYGFLGLALSTLRRYPDAIAAYNDGGALISGRPDFFLDEIGVSYYLLGDFDNARSSCEEVADKDWGLMCLAITYDKLGRHAEAEGMLAKLRAARGDTLGWTYSAIWGVTTSNS